MSETKFVYNARFVGRKGVEGPLNDFRLSEVVSAFQTDADRKSSVVDEIRCNVEFSDKNLLVTFIKKDEGFESDTESAKSVENSESVQVEDKSCSGDEKIINDHVLRLSGEDSDSETSDHNKSSSSGSSSASSTPTVELSKYKFDHLDTYSINDVLICHTDKVYKNCVIWVIRKSGSLEALVFECTSEDNARQLYRKFHEVSKRSKLERHRRRKSDGGSIVTRGSDFSNISSAGGLGKLKPSAENITINNIDTSLIEKAVEKNQQKWSLVQHTDKNGVTHIEVEASDKQQAASHLVKPREGGREGEARSLLSFSPQFSGRGKGKAGKGPDRSKFARELESILSSEVKKRSEGEASPYSRQRTPGESLSLRQRAPAMLLKKLDEFEEAAHKIWAKAEAEEENRKVWSGARSSNSVIGITTPAPPGPQLDKQEPRQEKEKEKERERKPSGGKTRQKEAVVKKEAEGPRILIPTKTGKEPPKKLYPKESPPLYGGRYLPLGVSGMGGLTTLTTQPHSLPIYPLQLAGAVPWGQHRSANTLSLSCHYSSLLQIPRDCPAGSIPVSLATPGSSGSPSSSSSPSSSGSSSTSSTPGSCGLGSKP